MHGGSVAPAGCVALELVKKPKISYTDLILRETDPELATSEFMRKYRKRNFQHIMRGLDGIQKAEAHGIPTFFGVLYLKLHRTYLRVMDGLVLSEDLDDYGLISCRVVTTAGVNFIVSSFQNAVEDETMRYHGFGTNNTAEAAGDTALGAESTTVLNPDNTRATGTLGVGATNNVFRTVGTATFDGSATITEHGIFSQAATGGGTLLDRSIFGGVGVSSGNALQATYDLTFTAGS